MNHDPTAHDRIETWREVCLRLGDDLLERAARVDAGDASSVARLRRDATPEQARVAIECALARSRARKKLPGLADGLIADRAGVEMASSLDAGAHKARRFHAALGGSRVIDLCSGIGIDAHCLASAGLDVTAVDLDAVRAWMSAQNAPAGRAVHGVVGDAGARCWDALPVHIDPARRTSSGARSHRIADASPPPEVVRSIIDRHRDVCVKLPPGIHPEELDSLVGGVAGAWSLEFLSESGTLTQALVWTGALAHERAAVATVLPVCATFAGEPSEPHLCAVGRCGLGRYVFTVDPSVERAGLLGGLARDLGAGVPHEKLGLLTSDRLLDSPFLTGGFEVVEEMPYRERALKRWLVARDAGTVEVKSRGGVVDNNRLQVELSGEGGELLTVFVLRFDRAVRAIVCRRC